MKHMCDEVTLNLALFGKYKRGLTDLSDHSICSSMFTVDAFVSDLHDIYFSCRIMNYFILFELFIDFSFFLFIYSIIINR